MGMDIVAQIGMATREKFLTASGQCLFDRDGNLHHFTGHVSHGLNMLLGFGSSSAGLSTYTDRSCALLVIATPAPMRHSFAIVTPSLMVALAPIRQHSSTVTPPNITTPGEIKQ